MLLKKTPIENKIVRDSYPNLIIDQVLEMIKKGSLKPGDALPSENELIAQFGVGRTSVREALAGLEYMNIIAPENGKNYINRDVQSFFSKKLLYHHKIDKKQHEDLLEVRKILEIEFTLLASQRATVNDIKRMRQILRKMGTVLSEYNAENGKNKEEEQEDFLDLSVEFHMAIAKATQNSMYMRVYGRFKELMFFSANTILDARYMNESYEIFQKILKSIEERDYQKAVANMKEQMDKIKFQYQKLEEKERADV